MSVLFTDTVTAFHQQNGAWTKTELRGVQWKAKTERTNDGGRSATKTVVSVTIPESVGVQGITEDGNTVLVLGTAPAITGTYTIGQLRKDKKTYCTVRSITDNTLRPKLKHWKVTAE